MLGSMAAATALAGCALNKTEVARVKRDCAEPTRYDDVFRVDAHCHLMNVHDGNAEAFLRRREYFGSENVGIRNPVLRNALAPFAANLSTETEFLFRQIAEGGMKDGGAFCEAASRRQRTVLPSGNGTDPGTAPLGFVRNRTRNAAIMMARWPEVDLFAPSMVDFYEVQGNDPFNLELQVEFYALLHRATKGRMVPLVSFHPVRGAHAPDGGAGQLDLVRKAISSQGFIGVKLHPSSGFDPLDNEKYGCPNTRLPNVLERQPLGAAGAAVQAQMDQLYTLCDALDAPILTHGGTGLSANKPCMQDRHPPQQTLAWTNSSRHWGEALEARPELTNLRVCLGHFAAGFARTPDGAIVPHPWLDYATRHIEAKGSRGRLWMDLSAMPEFVGASSPDRAAVAVHLAQHPQLHHRLLYGTDWHMPTLTPNGYRRGIESLFRGRQRRDVMGRNAVAFFGLDRPKVRTRLERFYAEHDIPLQDVRWHRRMRALGLA